MNLPEQKGLSLLFRQTGAILRFFFFLQLIAQTSLSSPTKLTLVGEKIPPILSIGSRLIFDGSDSLYLNQSLLERGVDYRFDPDLAAFDLRNLKHTSSDTLVIRFEKPPSWMAATFGNPIPQTKGKDGKQLPAQARPVSPARTRHDGSVRIKGTKAFRFTARESGGSSFSQSLDLKISGHLAHDLELTGSISDRGYNPSYGTANSRISELDKVNLQLRSPTLTIRVGDIDFDDRLVKSTGRLRKISGAAFQWSDKKLYAEGTAARPRGVFQTVNFFGQDGRQGPYQIGISQGVRPVVPGSEAVWLDGQQLRKGTNHDYEIDYATGQLTFNSNHPIDARSRIEIDYEPLATSYKGEIFAAAAGGNGGDSTFSVDFAWLREGDDKDQPLLGAFSDFDRSLLEKAGDDSLAGSRSGILVDSAGSYRLVADSLPDTVFQFVGEGQGEFRVRFSFVGQGNGAYRFLGRDNYEYVGKSGGDHVPLVFLPLPERTDLMKARVKFHNRFLGSFRADLRQTRFDRNLLSPFDDDDNDGNYYSLQNERKFLINGNEYRYELSTRRKEVRYRARERLYDSDFAREFFLPGDFIARSDEQLHELKASLQPIGSITVSPSFSRLSYDNSFESDVAGVALSTKLSERLNVAGGLTTVSTDFSDTSGLHDGSADIYDGSIELKGGNGYRLAGEYQRDERTNNYKGKAAGTRYDRTRTSLESPYATVQWERFIEDSLTLGWERSLRRDRLTLLADRSIRKFSYQSMVSYQWLKRPDGDEESFLSSLNYDYDNASGMLSVRGAYRISEETRSARGISFLEVTPGQGNFILEDGRFIPDGDGNYIRVEELLSDLSRVRRGEKSFQINKDWRQLLIRIHTNIEEELLPEGDRGPEWVLPFWSDESQPYLRYVRRYNADLRIFRIGGGHAVNITLSQDLEQRLIAALNRRKREFVGSFALKQIVKATSLEERLERFDYLRDSYYSGGGDIDGYKISFTVKQTMRVGEIFLGGGYRKAESSLKEKSSMYLANSGFRLTLGGKGEIRSSLELYRQTLDGAPASVSFRLTENKPGTKGAVWNVNLNYSATESWRVNIAVTGRHSDIRPGRVTARGDLIAGF